MAEPGLICGGWGRLAPIVLSVAAVSACDRPEPRVLPTAIDTPSPSDHAVIAWRAPKEGPDKAPVCPALRAPTVDVMQIEGHQPDSVAVVRPEKLEPFFERLAALQRGQRKDHVRIAVYGDSNLTMDFPTGRLRRVLQDKFGDGGHGFVALGRPWSHYQHMDVRHGQKSGFKIYAITTDPIGDGLYGLGGIVAENEWRGAYTIVETAPQGAPVGTSVGKFDVYYLRHRWTGTFEAFIDGAPVQEVDTNGDHPKLGVTSLDVEDGPHKLKLVARSPRRVRLLGVTLETDTPGIVVDSFGIGALNTKTMLAAKRDLNRQMLEARDYDLIVFMTGANDVFTMDKVETAMVELIDRQREALPNAPIVIVTPADRGKEESFSRTVQVVEQRRRIAEQHDLPYWDLWQAMGGRNSMSALLKRGYAHFDAVHFNEKGGAYVADRMAAALLDAYAAYLADNPNAGCGASPSTDAASERKPSPVGDEFYESL